MGRFRIHTFDNISSDQQGRNKKVFRALKLLGFAVPVAVFALLEVGRLLIDGRVSRWLEAVAVIVFFALGAVFFSHRIFKYIDSAHSEVSHRNQQLATLYKTGVAINSTLGLKETIQLIVDEAREQLGATAGELIIKEPVLELKKDGHAVYFSGFDPAGCEVRSNPHLAGLNGEVMRTGSPLRVDMRHKHPSSVRLPAGHIQFESVLSVPLTNLSGECIGAITLVKAAGAPAFAADDEALLVNFANQAAIAIVNASLYERVRYMGLLEERERIAREMHDSLGQVFAYMSIEMKIIDDLLANGNIDEAKKQLVPLRLTAEGTSVDVRETIVNLRTSLFPEEDLFCALGKYLKDYAERNEIETVLSFDDGAPPEFTRPAQIQLMCIIQEALANVRKHAGARQVEVKLLADNGSCEVWVTDDGCGFLPSGVPAHGKHLGLTVMEERAHEAGGRLEIKSEPGKGTKVKIAFPAPD